MARELMAKSFFAHLRKGRLDIFFSFDIRTVATKYISKYIYIAIVSIRLSEKFLSFTDTSFTTMHIYTNMKLNLSNVVIFILIEQNRSYVIR